MISEVPVSVRLHLSYRQTKKLVIKSAVALQQSLGEVIAEYFS